MTVIGYAITGVAIFITLGLCLQIRIKVIDEQMRERPRELQGFLMTASVVLVLFFGVSPFHLLWMIPASFILGILSAVTPLRILWIFSSAYFLIWNFGTHNAGRKLYLSGDYEKAIDIFRSEISQNPNSKSSYFNLALAHGKLGQTEQEIDAYERAAKLDSANPSIYNNLGQAYNDSGQKEKAISAFNVSIQLRPEHFQTHFQVCQAYAEISDYDNAVREYEIVKRMNPVEAEKLDILINAI